MNFETVRILFSLTFSVRCHPEILVPWQRGVTTSPLTLKEVITSPKQTHSAIVFNIDPSHALLHYGQ